MKIINLFIFYIRSPALFLVVKIYCSIFQKVNSSQIILIYAIYLNSEAREVKPSKYVSVGANTLVHIRPLLALIAPFFDLFTPVFDLITPVFLPSCTSFDLISRF
jgi:hypothetical protein